MYNKLDKMYVTWMNCDTYYIILWSLPVLAIPIKQD